MNNINWHYIRLFHIKKFMENILSFLDVPNTAFMLLSTSLVMLMTFGLTFFMEDWFLVKTILKI